MRSRLAHWKSYRMSDRSFWCDACGLRGHVNIVRPSYRTKFYVVSVLYSSGPHHDEDRTRKCKTHLGARWLARRWWKAIAKAPCPSSTRPTTVVRSIP